MPNEMEDMQRSHVVASTGPTTANDSPPGATSSTMNPAVGWGVDSFATSKT